MLNIIKDQESMNKRNTKKLLLTLISVTVLMYGCSSIKPNHNIVNEINADFKNNPTAAGGKIYYACDSGDDNNSGTSHLAPFKTASRALNEFNKMNGGDSVLFCRGGKFPSPNRNTLFNQKCSANSVCTLGAYGQGNKPEIFSTGQTAALYFTDGGAPSPSKGYVIKDLALVSDKTTLFGIQLYNDVDDVTIENVHIQGFGIGVYSAGANTVTSSTVNGTNDRLVLRDSTIINNYGQGWLGGGVGVLIENNVFENNGFEKAVFNHNIYLSGKSGHVTSDVIVRGNILYKSAVINGQCKGVSLVGHGLMNNVLIENNIIKEDEGTAGLGCWGIAIDPGYASEEVFNSLTIRNNTIENLGGLAIGCASCVDATIEGNTILDPSGTLTTGISVPNRAENTVKSKNVRIQNNIVRLGSGGASGVRVGGSHLYSVTGNIIDQPDTAHIACIDKKDANLNLDVSSNTCTKHMLGTTFSSDVNVALNTETNSFLLQDDEELSERDIEQTENDSSWAANDDEELSERAIEQAEDDSSWAANDHEELSDRDIEQAEDDSSWLANDDEALSERDIEQAEDDSSWAANDDEELSERDIEQAEDDSSWAANDHEELSERDIEQAEDDSSWSANDDEELSERDIEQTESSNSWANKGDISNRNSTKKKTNSLRRKSNKLIKKSLEAGGQHKSELIAVNLEDYQCNSMDANISSNGPNSKKKNCLLEKKLTKYNNPFRKCRAVSHDGRCLLR